MKIPMEISFRNISKNKSIESLIKRKVQKLEKIHDNITRCHTVIEMSQKDIKKGSPYRIRISLRIPHRPEIVVTREPGEGSGRDKLDVAIRDCFDRLYRRVKTASELQRHDIKSHSLQNKLNISV